MVYVAITASIAGSAVFPPLPSDGLLATSMSLAASGRLDLASVCAAAALGAVFGDLAAYGLGRLLRARPPARRAGASARRETALRWLRERERTWGPGLVVGGRFVPGGTMAVGVSAGLLRYPPGRYAAFSVLGSALWTVYGVAVGYLGRAAFPDNPWAGLGIAVATTCAVGAVAQGVRTCRRGACGPPEAVREPSRGADGDPRPRVTGGMP